MLSLPAIFSSIHGWFPVYKKVVHDEGYEEGREDGRKEGRVEGKLENMLDLVVSGMLKLEDAITKSGLTEAEFTQALEEYRKSKMHKG